MGWKISDKPTVDPIDSDLVLIEQGGNTRNTTWLKSKNFFLGTETLTTTAQTIKGAINENTASLSEKANKNWVINGGLEFWQRGTSLTNPANATYLVDRFKISKNITGTSPSNIVHSRQQLISGDIENSFYYYRINVDEAGSLNADDYYLLSQAIENGTRKLCGINKKVTLSFYARSSIANKKLGIYFSQIYGSGGTPSTPETINGGYFNLTSNWVKYTITVSTNTLIGKTFGSDNNDDFRPLFAYAYGINNASKVGDTVAETFGGTGNIDIAQIKLESGDKTTPFVPRLIGEELALCQRYYEVVPNHISDSNNSATTTSYITSNYTYKAVKRVLPSVVFNDFGGNVGYCTRGIIANSTTNSQPITVSSSGNGVDILVVESASGASASYIAFGAKADAEIY